MPFLKVGNIHLNTANVQFCRDCPHDKVPAITVFMMNFTSDGAPAFRFEGAERAAVLRFLEANPEPRAERRAVGAAQTPAAADVWDRSIADARAWRAARAARLAEFPEPVPGVPHVAEAVVDTEAAYGAAIEEAIDEEVAELRRNLEARMPLDKIEAMFAWTPGHAKPGVRP